MCIMPESNKEEEKNSIPESNNEEEKNYVGRASSASDGGGYLVSVLLRAPHPLPFRGLLFLARHPRLRRPFLGGDGLRRARLPFFCIRLVWILYEKAFQFRLSGNEVDYTAFS